MLELPVCCFTQRLEALGHRLCVVYGGLPAETRAAQARLFNDPDSG
jgi:ATP-dependent RNA helicase SUPV3L1/SUV3